MKSRGRMLLDLEIEVNLGLMVDITRVNMAQWEYIPVVEHD